MNNILKRNLRRDIDIIMTESEILKQLAEKQKLEKERLEQAAKIKAEEEKKLRLKKEAEAKSKLPKPKYYYDVKVECMLPATLTYRVLAEDAHQAADLVKNLQPTSVKHKLIGRKENKLSVYDAGSTMLKFVKNLFR